AVRTPHRRDVPRGRPDAAAAGRGQRGRLRGRGGRQPAEHPRLHQHPAGTPAGLAVAVSTPEAAVGQAAVDQLLDVLDLAETGPGEFVGQSPPFLIQRVYGGQVAGQALVAAGRTVPADRYVHSLHGYFVRPGDPSVPIRYQVEEIRDGRSFSVRRSVAYQHDVPIFFMSASFHLAEDGLDHHAPLPEHVPPPEELPSMVDRLARYPERQEFWSAIPRPIDARYVGEPGWVRPGDRPADVHQRV